METLYRKVIIVEKCSNCPYLRQYMECGKTRMTIKEVGIIPDWCPLEFQPIEPQEVKHKSDPHNDIYGPGLDNYGRDKHMPTYTHVCDNCTQVFMDNNPMIGLNAILLCPKCEVQPDKEKQGSEDVLDLQQYVTNLLYAAFDEGCNKPKSIGFNDWVEEQTGLLKEYAQSLDISVTDEEIEAIKFITENPYQDDFVCRNVQMYLNHSGEADDNSIKIAHEWSKRYDIVIEWLRDKLVKQVK
jgi:hypothetical protein